MDLGVSEEQRELAKSFGNLLTRASSPDQVRAAEPAGFGSDEMVLIERDDVRRRLARVATDLEVAQLLEIRTTCMEADGQVPVAEGPMSKLFSAEAIVRHAEDLTGLIGPDGLRSRLDPTAVQDGPIEHALRFSLGTTIDGGTSEIQRHIIAQRRCGLPRS
jgi:alkylation response protein AidB-like acyl-CoA dehydrogenase